VRASSLAFPLGRDFDGIKRRLAAGDVHVRRCLPRSARRSKTRRSKAEAAREAQRQAGEAKAEQRRNELRRLHNEVVGGR
jgi:hypothetical protein